MTRERERERERELDQIFLFYKDLSLLSYQIEDKQTGRQAD